METRMSGKPTAHRRGFMSAVVVHHQMDIELVRYPCIDGAQEFEELPGAMAPVQLADNLAAGHVQRGKQAGGAVARVVVIAPLCDAERKWQGGLRTIQGLNLGFLVYTQHHRMGGRIQIQPYNVTHLVDEQWITGELECLHPMRLQTKSMPD